MTELLLRRSSDSGPVQLALPARYRGGRNDTAPAQSPALERTRAICRRLTTDRLKSVMHALFATQIAQFRTMGSLQKLGQI